MCVQLAHTTYTIPCYAMLCYTLPGMQGVGRSAAGSLLQYAEQPVLRIVQQLHGQGRQGVFWSCFESSQAALSPAAHPCRQPGYHQVNPCRHAFEHFRVPWLIACLLLC